MEKLKTEYARMTIENHLQKRELKERQAKAEKYLDDCEDRCYYKTTAYLLLAVVLFMMTAMMIIH